MPELVTKLFFSKYVTVHADKRPVDLPARREDWVEFAFDNPVSALKEGLGGGERCICDSAAGKVTIRVLATSVFARDHLPALIQKTREEGGFLLTVQDQNEDSRCLVSCDSAGIDANEGVKRGANELGDVEIVMNGLFSITH
jgi:hypothetical protein